jgi:dethiobiotin synthetase
MRGLFFTATDTGVGKTVLSAALVAALSAAGESVRAFKPVVTGLQDAAEIAARGEWPADHELLATAAGMTPEEVAPLRYGPAVSPHLAAQLAGRQIDPAALLAAARAHEDDAGMLIVEGVGGLLTPLADEYSVCDLAIALGLPVVVAARPGLGTINHTLLTIRAARAAGLSVRAVVFTPWPSQPTVMQLSNRATVARLGDVEAQTLSQIPSPALEDLAAAGSRLLGLLD